MAKKALGNLFDVVMGVAPLDLQTARDGDWVNLKNAGHCTIVVAKGQGTDGDDQTFTLQQATTAAGGSSKAMATIDEYWEKEENAANLEATGAWTRVTQTAGSTVAPGDPSAQSAALYVFEVDAADLDVANGFDWIRLNSDGAGASAQLGTILYILSELRYPEAPQNLPSAIA